MVNFDDIDDWTPRLTALLGKHIPNSIRLMICKAAPEFIEDARDLLFDLVEPQAVIDAMITWIRSTKIAGYHGTRLTNEEVASIRTAGLFPLKAEARLARLTRAFSPHPSWPKLESSLNASIQTYGQGSAAGCRVNQAHLTLSKAGLVDGFNHYLMYGSEFDQHVANDLLGEEGMKLLALDGKPRVIQFTIPGDLALQAAHPYFSIEDMQRKGDLPNLLRHFLDAWCYKQAQPQFQSRTLKVDCGMVFNSVVPAGWITELDTLTE